MNDVEQCPCCGKRKGLRAARCLKCSDKVKRRKISAMCGASRTSDDKFHKECPHFIKNVMGFGGRRQWIAYRLYCDCICHAGLPKPLNPDPQDIQALRNKQDKKHLRIVAQLPPRMRAEFEFEKARIETKRKLKDRLKTVIKEVTEEAERPITWDVPLHDMCEVNLHEECPATAKQCGCACHATTS